MSNPSMWCYRRSVTQMLLHQPPLLRLLNVHKPGQDTCRGAKNCLLCAFKWLATAYWRAQKAPEIARAVDHVDALVNRLSKTVKLEQSLDSTSKDVQCDAQEFLSYVIHAFAHAGVP